LSDEATAIVSAIPDASRRIRDRVTAQRRQNATIISQVQEAAEIEKTADRNGGARGHRRAARWQVQVVEPASCQRLPRIGGMGPSDSRPVRDDPVPRLLSPRHRRSLQAEDGENRRTR
jgi:hypothetical protein